jgi:shikimate dehydrogenase
MRQGAVAVDIVYRPLQTAFLTRFHSLGCKTIDGLGMLLHQAVPAFHAWFGIEPKVTPALRARMLEALKD